MRIPLAAPLATLALAAPSGAQCLQQLLFPSDPQGLHYFGHELAAEGGLAAIGAPRDHTVQYLAGAVYVAERGPAGWAVVEELHSPGAGTFQQFGTAVAVDGGRIAATNRGLELTFVFERVGGVWTEVASLAPPASWPASFQYGWAMDLDGDTLVVADWANSKIGTNVGLVHVYRSNGGVWWYEATLTRTGAESYDMFGYDVALDGDRLVVGVPQMRTSPTERRGGAVVFERTAGVWSESAQLPGDARHSAFGWAVAIAGDRLAVTARGGANPGEYEEGLLVYELAAGTWSEAAHLPSGIDELIQYGEEVAMTADRIALSSPSEWVKAAPGDDILTSGVVHLFARDGGVWAEVGKLTGGPESGLTHGLAFDGVDVLAQDSTRLGAVRVAPFGPMFVRPFCFCPWWQATCNNEDPLAGCANATGSGAHLGWCGTTSVGADDLVLRAEGVVPTQIAVLIMGRDIVPPSYLGNGVLCIGDSAAIRRHHVEQAGTTGAVTYGPGIVAESQSFPPSGRIVVGSTWNFQLWYRDPGACGTGSNATNALGITFAQ